MNNFQKNIDRLKADVRCGRTIFFVGAGVSLNSGVPIVSNIYSELADFLEITREELQIMISGRPFESIMALLLMDDHIRDHFKKLFGQKIPTATHYYLANQLINSNARFIITTNFDQLIEIAYEKTTGKKLRAIVPKGFDDFNPIQGEPSVIKLHGCISNDLNSLGVTINAIANTENKECIENILSKLIPKDEDYSLVFMGYSGSDVFDIGPALEKILTKRTYIYRVRHSNEEYRFIKPLDHPYQNLNGIELECNVSSPYLGRPQIRQFHL